MVQPFIVKAERLSVTVTKPRWIFLHWNEVRFNRRTCRSRKRTVILVLIPNRLVLLRHVLSWLVLSWHVLWLN